MTTLRRHLKKKFLIEFLERAQLSFKHLAAAAVHSDGRVLAAVGPCASDLKADNPHCLSFPLTLTGEPAGDLLLQGPELTADDLDSLKQQGEMLAYSLQAQIDAAEKGRAMTAETLDVYRELSLLYRATVSLNQSLDETDVARSLLLEIEKADLAAQWGAVLSCENKAEGFHLLNSFGDLDESVVQKITTSPLFRDIIDLEKGQIINDLASDDRWPNTCPDLKILLIMPLVAHDQCSGALILGSGNENDLFSAGDLKQATAMAAIAAEILYNAHLFQEVVEARNYNENILENLSNGVITLDLALCVTKANAAARRILQQDEQKLLGTAIGDLFTGENTWIAEPFNQNSIGKRGIYWTDRDLKIGDAEGVTVNLSAVPLENVEHRQIGFMLILEDITREKRIKGTMARFMSERVVEKVMDAGESVLGGAAQDATVLFSDIRNFTGLSEDLNPKQMVETLNSYFTDMVDVIFERGGTLDKFIGDAIMAVFGAPFVTPDDPDNAAHAAIEMMLRLEAFNRLQDNRIGPVLDMGIGINSGTVVAGTIGSPRRMDYTVIGDQVNLASRIEAANKYYGTKILVSEHTAKRFRKSYSMREVDLVKVAGRQAPTALFEILDYHSENTFPEMDSVLEAYGKGLHHYRHREWVQGAKYFTAALRANPNDRATQIFLHRCWTHAARPPDDNWSSVTDLART